jgi:hypothetical protein
MTCRYGLWYREEAISRESGMIATMGLQNERNNDAATREQQTRQRCFSFRTSA